MAPKKAAVAVAEPPSSAAPAEEKEKKTDAAALRKLSTHPSTAIMVREALKELDSRKGVSSQAIQNYIKQKYPSVDLVRLKHLVRKALKKGIENGTLVRPANSTVTTGATGKFRLAPKKEAKAKAENVDPNVPKAPKTAKQGAKGEAKKPKKNGAKKKAASKEEDNSSEEPKSKDEEGSSSKAAPAKKTRVKKAAETEEGGDSESVKPKGKAAKEKEQKQKPEKEQKPEKTGKAAQNKRKPAQADGDGPATKALGKRGKKASE